MSFPNGRGRRGIWRLVFGLSKRWAENFDIDAGAVEDAVPLGLVGKGCCCGDHGFEAGGLSCFLNLVFLNLGFLNLVRVVVDLASEEFSLTKRAEEIAFEEPEFEGVGRGGFR